MVVAEVALAISLMIGAGLFLRARMRFDTALLAMYAGIILLLALYWFAADLSPLWLSVATSVTMIVVAVWESVSLGSKVEEAAEH